MEKLKKSLAAVLKTQTLHKNNRYRRKIPQRSKIELTNCCPKPLPAKDGRPLLRKW